MARFCSFMTVQNIKTMKKYIVAIIMILCTLGGYAQTDNGMKSEKKQAKLEKKAGEMNKDERNGRPRRAARKMHKMENKEEKLNKKEDKMK